TEVSQKFYKNFTRVDQKVFSSENDCFDKFKPSVELLLTDGKERTYSSFDIPELKDLESVLSFLQDNSISEKLRCVKGIHWLLKFLAWISLSIPNYTSLFDPLHGLMKGGRINWN